MASAWPAAIVVAALALTGLAVWVSLELVRTLRSVRSLAERTDDRLPPLLDKASVTVDAVNAEVLRLDGIVTRMEEVSDSVSHATHAATEAVNVPIVAVSEIKTRLGRVISGLFRQ